MSENAYRLNIDEIRRFLPHRAPFLFVDRILEIHPQGDLNDLSPEKMVGIKVVGIKNVSYNEPFFQGHFPSCAILPGVIIVETMAQVSSFSLYPYMCRDIDRLARDFQCIMVGVDAARFRRPVVPGDTLRIETVVTKCRGKLWAFHCEATVDGQKVAEADILANLIANTGDSEEAQ
ncbi:MAG: 3-hydroxyacyl-ACP dehydratase FabZ [Oligoflexia bacterium]|nr:3-hydroxyacyl-ACP dehydratase FabZ [Oligoflexia bacterium]